MRNESSSPRPRSRVAFAAQGTRLACLGLALFLSSACDRWAFHQEPEIVGSVFEKTPPRSIAVLPFRNATQMEKAGDEARRAMALQLSALRYADVERDKVDSVVSQLAVDRDTSPDRVPASVVCGANLADALLTGEIQEVTKRWLIFYSHIKVKMELELTDARTRKVIYRNVASGTNRRLATPLSIVGIFTGAYQTLRHLGDKEMAETLEDFSKAIAKDFPKPPEGETEGRYYIRDAKLILRRDPMRAGDVLTLEFQGTPGQKAYFDLGAEDKDIPMKEVRPGAYAASYAIKPNQQADYCVVRCKLSGPDDTVEVSLHDKPFRIASLAPGETRIVEARFLQNSVLLLAKANSTESDAAAFLFYRARAPKGPYELIGQSSKPLCEDRNIQPNQLLYYTVATQSRSGKRGPASSALPVRIPPKGPSQIAGDIRSNAKLQAYSGPYILPGRVRIMPDATLTVDPGVDLIFAPGASLEAQGRLAMMGEAGKPIRCYSAGNWEGISLGSSGAFQSHTMNYVSVQRAVAGVTVRNGELKANGCEFRECQVGVAVAGGAKAELRNSSFVRAGQGVQTDAAALAIEGCRFQECAVGVLVRNGHAAVSGSNFVNCELAARNLTQDPMSLVENYLGTIDPVQALSLVEGRCDISHLFDAPRPGGVQRALVALDFPTLIAAAQRADGQGDRSAAAQALVKALVWQPDRQVYLKAIPMLRNTQQGRLAEALSRTAALIYPEDRDILLMRAETLYWLGQKAQADALCSGLRALYPNDPAINELQRKYT